jgi:Trk K+ transport system NAD-binding subunit
MMKKWGLDVTETSKSCLVLGCGDIGYAIANRLKCHCAKVAIIERDEGKVELLKLSLGYDALLGDFSSPEVLKRAGMERYDTVIITTRDFPTTERTLEAISELKAQLGIRPLVLALVKDEAEVKAVKRLGADEVLPYSQILANFVVGRLEKEKARNQE